MLVGVRPPVRVTRRHRTPTRGRRVFFLVGLVAGLLVWPPPASASSY